MAWTISRAKALSDSRFDPGPEQQWSMAMSQWSFPISARNTRPTLRFRLSALQSSLGATIRLWIARSRQRRHLAEMVVWDDHILKDIGVSRDAALREAAKPFWRR